MRPGGGAARGAAAALGPLGLVEPDGSVRKGTGGLTTPGPVAISTWLADLAEEGAKSVTVEASSHALEQRRLDGVRFDAVVFTNLSQDFSLVLFILTIGRHKLT